MIDPWKRSLPSAADDAANVMSGYQQQLEINFKPAKASPEVIEKWDKEDRAWWGKHSFKMVIGASILQVFMLGFMGMTMYLIQLGVK